MTRSLSLVRHGWQGSWFVGAPVSVRRRGVRGSGWAGRPAEGRASGVRKRDQVGQGHPLERPADGVPDPDPEEIDRAARRSVAGELVGGLVFLAGADHRGDRPLERAQDVRHPDVLGRPGELVAAVGAAGGDHQPGVAQAHDQLLEVRPRQLFLGGDSARLAGPAP